jgi:hypothetical protein
MKNKQIDLLVGTLYSISTLFVLVGALCRIMHYPNGLTILIVGFLMGAVISSWDNYRLKKRIKSLEEQLNHML